ncbi:MAG: transcriptional regulator GcvA [Methylobacteriaceae bacterium]|nr:transcriptional regulator GcvA [Methylobacteriaceae bacterium]
MRASPTLPPLHALRAFEAVGRLMSFRRAGEELLITQSAVSHHIRQLEDTLGMRLFERRARSIALTPAGERYLDVVARAFAVLADGTAELTALRTRRTLRLSLLPSFAANWLVPRLGRFREAHPEVDVELDPTLRLVDLAAGEADLAIRYGDGRWPGVRAELLMAERLTPVLSPDLARAHLVQDPADVLALPLLLTKRPYDWDIWAAEVGLDLSAARSIQLTDYNIVLQAAIDGEGVALGRTALIEDRLRAGLLVAPCPRVVTSPLAGHWLLSPERRRPSPAVQAFALWIRQEAKTVIRSDPIGSDGSVRPAEQDTAGYARRLG